MLFLNVGDYQKAGQFTGKKIEILDNLKLCRQLFKLNKIRVTPKPILNPFIVMSSPFCMHFTLLNGKEMKKPKIWWFWLAKFGKAGMLVEIHNNQGLRVTLPCLQSQSLSWFSCHQKTWRHTSGWDRFFRGTWGSFRATRDVPHIWPEPGLRCNRSRCWLWSLDWETKLVKSNFSYYALWLNKSFIFFPNKIYLGTLNEFYLGFKWFIFLSTQIKIYMIWIILKYF